MDGPLTCYSPAPSCCRTLQVPGLLAVLAQLQGVATLREPCAASMLPKMLSEMRELHELLGDST